MSVYLLDVNVLVALAWPTHEAHARVQKWMSLHARQDWATCPFTQAAFVRILSNPAFSPHALTSAHALSLLAANLTHARHRFWEDDITFPNAVEPFADRIVGHQHITDAYLLGLAIHRKSKFATLDRAVVSLLREPEQGAVVVTINFPVLRLLRGLRPRVQQRRHDHFSEKEVLAQLAGTGWFSARCPDFRLHGNIVPLQTFCCYNAHLR